MKYSLVVCGGTFDRFHKGHEAFLSQVFALGQHVLLGITSDAYIDEFKKHSSIESYDLRKKHVVSYLKKQHYDNRVTIAPIHSVMYPLEWELLPIEALIVTEDTKKGAEEINQNRLSKNLHPLEINTVRLKPDDVGDKISSRNIREGTINIKGEHYIQPSWFANDLILPEIERKWFKEPFGEFTTDNNIFLSFDPQKLITVGDVVTADCNRLKIHQKLSIVDFTVQRKKIYHTTQQLGFAGNEIIIPAKNPAGHITTSLYNAITKAISLLSQNEQIVITVTGEEDLAVIPLVLALPLGCTILYGQPNKGIVYLEVSLEMKDKAHNLLQRLVPTRGH